MSTNSDSTSRKWLMRQYWRLQQSQSIISMIFWINASTLLIWPYIRWRFNPEDLFLGIPMTYWGILSIALLVMIVVLIIGWTYDKIFSLWKEHQNVVLERNPWATYQLTPRDAMILGYVTKLIRKQNLEDEKIQKECDWVEKWLFAATKLEAFDRMVNELDKILDEPVPELHIFPEGTVSDVRKKLSKKEE